MNKLVLHLGSNQGDRLHYLEVAIKLIQEQVGVILACSFVYETAAWGVEDQDSFYNLAITCQTDLHPFQVLDKTQSIETQIGRNKSFHWGPRNIDVDILYFNELIINTKRLIIPHPLLHIRNFVLYPLNDVDNEGFHPIFGRSNRQLLQDCQDDQQVEKIDSQISIE